VIEKWHAHLRGERPAGWTSPGRRRHPSRRSFHPQRGKALTTLYLQAASQTLPGDGAPALASAEGEGPTDRPGRFRYTKQVLAGDTAVLEFETSVEGTYVNGVDIIRCNDEGRIVEFRVMLRPLKAINLVHAQMRAMLDQMGSAG
jgi:hypothetical protein